MSNENFSARRMLEIARAARKANKAYQDAQNAIEEAARKGDFAIVFRNRICLPEDFFETMRSLGFEIVDGDDDEIIVRWLNAGEESEV